MPAFPVSLADVNGYSATDFVDAFGDVAEGSPWVAEAAAALRPFATREAAIAAFIAVVGDADPDAQTALIRAHPDLAGKAAIAGEIAEDSRKEQAGVGLDRLTAAEFERFTALNDGYKEKFGFPFLYAVKGATKSMILAAFEDRIHHDAATEFETALAQIGRIFRFRLEDRIAS